MNRLAEILKRHIWCVITIAAIILLALITLSFGEDVNLVSHLSLTSAVVSIVLAVIVIVYMYFQDQRSSQNITEMRKLIDEGYRTMTDKASLMVDKAQSIEQTMMGGITQLSPADSQPIPQPLEIQEPLQFDVSVYKDLGILILYALVKSHELGKPMSLWKISNLIFKENKPLAKQLFYYSYGAIQSLRAFLGRDDLILSYEQQELKKLPDGFKESIITRLDNILENHKGKEENKEYAFLEDSRDLIDNYFDDL